MSDAMLTGGRGTLREEAGPLPPAQSRTPEKRWTAEPGRGRKAGWTSAGVGAQEWPGAGRPSEAHLGNLDAACRVDSPLCSGGPSGPRGGAADAACPLGEEHPTAGGKGSRSQRLPPETSSRDGPPPASQSCCVTPASGGGDAGRRPPCCES